MDHIVIFDTTLRDGEQSPGCSMNLKEKIEVARCLERMKVDIIEAGFAIKVFRREAMAEERRERADLRERAAESVVRASCNNIPRRVGVVLVVLLALRAVDCRVERSFHGS